MIQKADRRLKASLILSTLRETLKLRRSFWLEAFNQEAELLSFADNALLKDPAAASQHHLFSKINAESKQALIRVLRSDSFHQKIKKQLQVAKAHKISAVSWLSPSYPDRLLHISSYPLVLYYRGSLPLPSLSQMNGVTVVGTRKPSYYGRQVVQKMTSEWCDRGLVCVSGLARGIDGLAHQTALEKGAPTIAVLANGLDVVYPPEHLALYEHLLTNGLAISEHPPGQKPLRQHFPARNRILSGLCQAVVVIEAAEKSGSLITAEFAADQGREVFAVPGTIISAGSRGCNLLIKDGAGMLLCAEDIYLAYDFSETTDLVKDKPETASLPMKKPEPERLSSIKTESSFQTLSRSMSASDSGLSALKNQTGSENNKNTSHSDLFRIKDVLRACPLSISTICSETGLSPSKCAILLTQMELSGQVFFERGHYSLTE